MTLASIRPDGRDDAPTLLWPAAGGHADRVRRVTLEGLTLFVRPLPDDDAHSLLAESRSSWQPAEPLTSTTGDPVAHVWRDDKGNVFLPFDPSEAIATFWQEAYVTVSRGRVASIARGLARSTYYRLRPALPRSLQLRLRQRFARIQGRAPFPGWPAEPVLHDFYGWLLTLVGGLADAPVPTIAPWPAGYSWALVLTHDVESALGYREIGRLADVEERLGYRSSWNLVPERDYRVEPDLVATLQERGFEVGLHGLRHDGHDILPNRSFEQRLPSMRAYAREWRAVGFRAPATHRLWDRMPRLELEYDSSYSDTAPYEPQPGGSCTWWPFMNRDLVELPITLAQDHTLFELLDVRDEGTWVAKADYLRERGGMALALTHPDYMIGTPAERAYVRLLERYSSDATAWKPLPREVSDWWRRRGASYLRRSGERWEIVGPASEGVVALHA